MPEAGTTDHLCWVYDDDAVFDRAVTQFLSGGLERGERLLCVGEQVIDSLRGLPLSAEDVGALIARGALQTQTTAQAYEAAGGFLPEDQLSHYEAATRQALADGYRGLRVVAEVSALAADPVTRAELLRWEQLADDLISREAGFTAMCAYSGRLPREARTDVAAVHPLVHAAEGTQTFRVFSDGDRLVLAGSVDTFCADRLARVLAAAPVGPDRAVLDLSLLQFVDVAGCRVLVHWARGLHDRRLRLEVRGASRLVRRMWGIITLGTLVSVDFEEAAA